MSTNVHDDPGCIPMLKLNFGAAGCLRCLGFLLMPPMTLDAPGCLGCISMLKMTLDSARCLGCLPMLDIQEIGSVQLDVLDVY